MLFLNMIMQLSQHHFLKRLSIELRWCFCQELFDVVHVNLFMNCLFWSIYLFACPHSNIIL